MASVTQDQRLPAQPQSTTTVARLVLVSHPTEDRRLSWPEWHEAVQCCRCIGIVFLVFRNETRPGLLPNEVSSINTVWALFVRAFPDTLSMHWFESSKWTIYFLDQLNGVYRVLQDLRSETFIVTGACNPGCKLGETNCVCGEGVPSPTNQEILAELFRTFKTFRKFRF